MPDFLRFLAEFARDALAAGFGALVGAKYAFGLERRKAAEERTERERAAAAEVAERTRAAAAALAQERATEGNLALFALAQIHNDLLVYRSEILRSAKKSNSPWWYLEPTDLRPDDTFDYRFDVRRLSFLLASRQPGAPDMLMRLAQEQDRFKGFLATVGRRSDFHQQHVPEASERLLLRHGREHKFTDSELQEAVGPRVYAQLRNYFSDIETLVDLGIKSSKQAAEELRRILTADLPGQTIIGFEAPEPTPGVAMSPVMQARDRAASRDGPAAT